MKNGILIGIAGASGSGKTLVSKNIYDNLGSDKVVIMQEDSYYKDLSEIPFDERTGKNFDHPDAFDLVITDQTMPNMTGKELAKKLMQLRPGIPIILCTGFSEQIDSDKAKEMGISAFIMKPIDMSEIADTIRKVFDEK